MIDQQDLEGIRRRIDEVDDEIDSLKGKRDKLRDELEMLKSERNMAEVEVHWITAEIGVLKTNDDQFEVVKTLRVYDEFDAAMTNARGRA